MTTTTFLSNEDAYNLFSLGLISSQDMTVQAGSQKTFKVVFQAQANKFTMTCAGLRPLTRHWFYFDRQASSANCQPRGGVLGAPLITDANGQITFDFFYRPPVSAPVDNEQAYYAMVSNAVGTKSYTIGDADVPAISNEPSLTFMSWATGKVMMATQKYDELQTIRTVSTTTSYNYTYGSAPPREPSDGGSDDGDDT